jgi:hypothetical protein
MNTYLLWINDQQAGPFSMTQLKSMWLNGAITAATLYWREEIQEWCSLGPMVENAIKSEQFSQSKTAALSVPEAKGWSTSEYVILVICTLIIPIVGLLVGFIGVFNPAKRQRAANLMGLGLLVMILAYFFLAR